MTAYLEIQFGSMRLDPVNSCIWQGASKRPLTPKDFAVLYTLAVQSGNLVSKEELIEAVWAQTAVSDDVLKTCIGRIRKILQDDFKSPTYIETVHRRGYRFICPVKTNQEEHGFRAPQAFLPHRMVGRSKQLARLHGMLERARSGRRQTVFISGEAGIGKTTLVEAFCSQAKEHCGVLVVQGQCVENYGSGEPYQPILEALGRLCHIDDCSLVVEIMKRFAPMWLLQMPWLLSQDEIEALQKLMIGATPDRMLRELAESLENVSNEVPLIIVIEDLHWSDVATLDALNAIARRPVPAKLMVICTFRPEGLSVRKHPLLSVTTDLVIHGHCGDMPLPMLSKRSLQVLLNRRYPDRAIPDGFVQWLYRHSDGNPLFVNALIDHAENMGWMKVEETIVYPAIKDDSMIRVVPGSLQQLIKNNLSRITTEERQVIEAGSVVGTTFPLRILADSAEQEEQIDAVCHRLARRSQILFTAGMVDWPDGTQTPCYRFIHALHQQVAYDTIPPLRTQRLHLEIGHRLENAYRNQIGEMAAALAVHFNRGKDFQKAVVYSQHAGEIAMSRHAYHDVVTHMERGLKMLQMIPDNTERGHLEVTLQIMLGNTLVAVQGYASPEVEGAFSRAHELCSRSEPRPQYMPVLFGLWMYYLVKADFEKARQAVEYYFHIAVQTPDQAFLAIAYATQSLTDWYQGRFVEAGTNAEKSIATYDPKGHQAIIQQHGLDAGLVSWGHKAISFCLMGYPDRACDEVNTALKIGQKYAGPFMIASMLAYKTTVCLFRRDLSQLRSVTEELISLANEHGIVYWLSTAEIMQAWAQGMEGNSKESLSRISDLIRAYRSTGANLMVNFFQYLLADVHRAAIQPNEGIQAIGKAIALTEITDARWIEGELHRLKGDLYLLKSTKPSKKKMWYLNEAETSFFKALDVAHKQKTKLFELRAALGLSHVMDKQGKRFDALQVLKNTLDWFEEGFDIPDLRKAKEMIGNLSRD